MAEQGTEYITESSEHYYMQLVPEKHRAEVRAHYAQPHRRYHTWQHIKELWLLLEQIDGALECLPAVALATAFHDIVYNPRKKDNEARSAALMRRMCRGVDLYWVERADTLICATEQHLLPSGWQRQSDAGYFLDMDLAILAAGRPRYQEYAQQVRQEYAHVTAPKWAAGRGQALTALVRRAEQDTLYNTDWGRAEFGVQALANMRWELDQLQQGAIA